MAKKRGKAKKSVKKIKKTIKKDIILNSCRQASGKSKHSKVKKLIKLARKNPKPEKKGFFSRLFGG
jgi:hypothetical protein